MEILATKAVKVNVKTLQVHMKVVDTGSYTLLDADGEVLRNAEGDYVPDFMPGQHYGDYIDLHIDIDTGQITNWKVPSVRQIEAFIEEGRE